MNHRQARWIVLGTVSFAMLVGGCAVSRPEYFSDLAHRRSLAYTRWQEQSFEDERPQIEGELSLEEAVRLALRYNTLLQAAIQEKGLAKGRLFESYSEALPRVDLSAGYTRLDQVYTMDLGTESFAVGDLDNYSYQVTITQPLFKGGKMFVAQRAARLYSCLTDENIRGVVENVVFAAAKAYYDTVLAERLIGVQEAALESAQAHLESVSAREREGVATEFDVLRARVEVSIVEAGLIEQKNRRDVAGAALLRAAGVSQRSEVELVTDLGFHPGAPSFEDAVRSAFERRPDIYTAAIELDLQNEALKVAYTDYLPHLEAYYWRLWAKPDPHEGSKINWGDQWQAGLALTWPLFDGLAREGNVLREKALLRQKEIGLTDAEEQAILEVRTALLELQNAREFCESQQQNLTQAQRALELAEARYRAQVSTEIEVLDARTAVTRARGLYYQALHRHTVGKIALQKAMGLIGPGPGMEEIPGELSPPGKIPDVVFPVDRDNQQREGAPFPTQ